MSPGPSARCIRTPSSQRPNLKPMLLSVPTISKPQEAWSRIDGRLGRIADHGHHLALAERGALSISTGNSALPTPCPTASLSI